MRMEYNMADELTFSIYPLQTSVQTRLQAHAYLSDIPVLTEEKGDIDNQIDLALGVLGSVVEGGKLGACIVILTPTAKNQSPNAPGPLLEEFLLVINVLESVAINQGDQGTKKHAIQIVEFILRYLHRWTIPGTNAAIKASSFLIIGSDPLTYQVNFITSLCLKPEN